jgi:hypothetical protein
VTGRRVLVLLIVLAAIGVPAATLQVLCVGGACPEEADEGRVPFCTLPEELRTLVANGYREGRSPDVLAVAAGTPVYTEIGNLRIAWPSSEVDSRVPVVLWGASIASGEDLGTAVTLDRIAPTLARAVGFARPFPEVRSGAALTEALAGDEARPRLLVLVAWKGVGTRDLEADPEAWPFLAELRSAGAGTLEARAGSLPLDPAATLTTIGTGGLPSQHGITGSFVRNDEGEVVEPFGPGAPVTVIATLADDLEHADGSTQVGLVASEPTERGLVGGGWYPDQDPVDTIIGDAEAAPLAVDVLLSAGLGSDDVPDVLGVVLEGRVRRLDRLTERIVRSVEAATGGAVTVAIAGTGAWEANRLAVADRAAVEAVEEALPGAARAVEAVVPGGLFLDQDVLREQQVTGQVPVDALASLEHPAGGKMMADAFQGFAVSFSRYC